MEKHEILEFLELDADASLASIKNKVEQKLKHFENLSENAASDFLKRMHLKNLDKMKRIQKEVMLWSDEPAFIQPQHETAEKIIDAEKKENYSATEPIIVSSRSRNPGSGNMKSQEPAGWLVRHTENQTVKTFILFSGKNYLGRKQQTGLSNFIVIDDDVFVSRIHAVIEIEAGDEFEFYICDSESSNLGKKSKNGTYINGDEKRITQRIRLHEGDTIQVGVTKLIFKINRDNNLKKVIKEVQSKNFMHTVIIDQ